MQIAGLMWNIIFTCTTIPDPTDPSKCMLQIRKVEKERIEVDRTRLLRQISRRMPGLTMTFKPDLPGVNAAIMTQEELMPILMHRMPRTEPPCVALLYVSR